MQVYVGPNLEDWFSCIEAHLGYAGDGLVALVWVTIIVLYLNVFEEFILTYFVCLFLAEKCNNILKMMNNIS